MSDQLEALNDFRFKTEISVAWGEMDAYGHVNNVAYFRYFETAQVRYFDNLRLSQLFRRSGIGAVIHKVSCTYMIPIVYPDTVTIGVRVTEVGKESLSMEFFLLSKTNGLSAFGESEMVLFDFNSSKRIPVPKEVSDTIKSFENNP